MTDALDYAQLSRLEDAYELWGVCGIRVGNPKSAQEAGWRDYFETNPSRFIAAYDNAGKLQGTCVLFLDGRKGRVYRLAVRPEWRRKGLARTLIALAEDHVKAAGLNGICALVEKTSAESMGLFRSREYFEIKNLCYFTKTV